jgi:hypothetical protein
MPKSHQRLLTAAATAALVLGSSAVLAEEQPQTKDMTDALCKDVMRYTGEDRVIALAILHGYRLGKKNTTKYDPEALGRISDEYMEYCLDHPNEKALASFEKIAG